MFFADAVAAALEAEPRFGQALHSLAFARALLLLSSVG